MIVHADTRSILNAFFRHRRLFMLFFLPINVAGASYLLLATPAYESTAKLLVKFGENVRPEMALDQSRNSDSSTVDEQHELVQSNVKILTSRDLAETLLNEITLGRAYPKIVDDPPSRGTLMDAAVKHYNDDLVIKTESDSPVINVGMYNADPAIAETMLRRLIDLFITYQSEVYSNPQTGTLLKQAQEAYDKLKEADKHLHEYEAKAGIASVDQELGLLLQQRAEIAGYISRRPAIKGAAGSKQPVAEMTAYALPAQIPTSGGDRFPVLEDVQKTVDALRAHKAELSQTYRPDSDVMKNLQNNIDMELKAQNESVRALNRQIADLDVQIAEKSQHKAQYEDLMREVQLDEDDYKAAQTRAHAAEADQDLNQRKITQISIIEQPTLPYKPTRPWKALVVAFCLLAGLSFGFAACIIVESLDRTFSLPEQAAALLGLPVIASFAYRSPQEKRAHAYR